MTLTEEYMNCRKQLLESKKLYFNTSYLATLYDQSYPMNRYTKKRKHGLQGVSDGEPKLKTVDSDHDSS